MNEVSWWTEDQVELLREALHHLEQHGIDYHHVTPPKLLARLKAIVGEPKPTFVGAGI